jgi:hypothetical protein
LRSQLIATALACFASSAAQAWDNCSKRELRARSTVTIDLEPFSREVRLQPAFYYHDRERSHVFFVKAEDVVGWVESHGDSRPLLDLLRRDLPLKEDTDLFKYSLQVRSFSAGDISYLLSDLIEKGRAMVDEWPIRGSTTESAEVYDRQDPLRIKRVSWSARGADGWKFCREDGFEILTIVETIYD